MNKKFMKQKIIHIHRNILGSGIDQSFGLLWYFGKTLFWNSGNISTHQHEGKFNLLSMSCASLSLLLGERLWGKSPWTGQGDLQKSQPDSQSQPYKGWGDRSPPQTKERMDMEPVLCTGGAHRTRYSVRWKGRHCTINIYFMHHEDML